MLMELLLVDIVYFIYLWGMSLGSINGQYIIIFVYKGKYMLIYVRQIINIDQ